MASSSRPATLAKAVKGVLFGTIRYLVDTFNWIVSCWDNLDTGSGLTLEGKKNGTPKLKLNLTAGNGVEIVEGEHGEVVISSNSSGGGGSIVVDVGDVVVSDVSRLTFRNSENVIFSAEQNNEGEVEIWAKAVYA